MSGNYVFKWLLNQIIINIIIIDIYILRLISI